MSYQPPYQQYPQQQPGAPGAYGSSPIVCPFCGGTSNTQLCNWCGRDTTAPRRPCPKCRRMALTSEPVCWNCGSKFRSELGWKIPVIILIFVLSIVVSILIRSF